MESLVSGNEDDVRAVHRVYESLREENGGASRLEPDEAQPGHP